MNEWLVSVIDGDKVVELYYSESLHDLGTIRALHKDCKVEVMRVGKYKPAEPLPEPVYVRQDNPKATKHVRCKETGKEYVSVSACSVDIGVSRWNVYKAVQRGLAIDGKHYNYVREGL